MKWHLWAAGLLHHKHTAPVEGEMDAARTEVPVLDAYGMWPLIPSLLWGDLVWGIHQAHPGKEAGIASEELVSLFVSASQLSIFWRKYWHLTLWID